MLSAFAIDKAIRFRFVTPSKFTKTPTKRNYDLSIVHSDGVRVCAEAKCKLEETKITLKTIEKTLSYAKDQLPKSSPGIVFVKIPRFWVDDESFAHSMHKLAQRSIRRSPWITSIKYYTAQVTHSIDKYGVQIGELVAFREFVNPLYKFRRYATRDWNMFPTTGAVAPPEGFYYNGMPHGWQRLLWPVRRWV